MTKSTGPRRQVLARREIKKAQQIGALRGAVPFKASPSIATVASDGLNLHLHSTSEPALREGDQYTVSATQGIDYGGADIENISQQSHLQITQKLYVPGSKSTLDPSLVHSVYPPPSHSEYWDTLPHVLFNDPQTPWLFNSGDLNNSHSQEPYLALFVFSHDELYMTSSDLSKLGGAMRRPSDPAQGPTLSIPMTNTEFQNLAPRGSDSLGGQSPSETWGKATMQAIFIKEDLFNATMVRQTSSVGDGGVRNPSIGQWNLSHVRTVNMSGMTDVDGIDAGTYAVTVSHRTGPPNLSVATAVYAHLVVIPGDKGSGRTSKTEFGTIGLCSLYSWTYNCLPFTEFTLKELMQGIGNNIQPLRLPESSLSELTNSSVPSWLRNRLQLGYSLGKYRTLTGEETTCKFRGLLVPQNPHGEGHTKNLPSSDFGTDLSFIDSDSGMIDVTYHMAWTLGRSMAMADRSFSAALMRVRGMIHTQALVDAKKDVDRKATVSVHKPIGTVVNNLQSTKSNLKSFAQSQGDSNFKGRWAKPATQPSTRDMFSFTHESMKNAYRKGLRTSIFKAAGAANPDPQQPPDTIYDETGPPASTDWATIFAWMMDKWYLGGIPVLHLIPDPGFVPKESIRTFYIDPDWFKSYIDGALSITEHYTDQDDAREAIKDAIHAYLHSNLTGKDHPPQLPRFGLFLRSELVKKFSNLKFSAPLDDNSSGQDEILRVESIDQDLIVVLFDRIPGANQFPQGITISPPPHQLSFTFGNAGWDFKNPANQTVTQKWKNVWVPVTENNTAFSNIKVKEGRATRQYSSSTADVCGFDFTHNAIRTPDLLAHIKSAVIVPDDGSGGSSSSLGYQLVAEYPTLTILDAETGQQPNPIPGIPLSRVGWTCTCDSEQLPECQASNVLDGDSSTMWHTEWRDKQPAGHHWIQIDMKRIYKIASLTYLPRQDWINGMIKEYVVLIGTKPDELFSVAQGSDWAQDYTVKSASFEPVLARYVRLFHITEVRGNIWASAAEINIISAPTTMPPHSVKTATRARYELNPPLVGQDPQPPARTAPTTSNSSKLASPPAYNPTRLLRMLADTDITNWNDYMSYVAGVERQSNNNVGDRNSFPPMFSCTLYNLRSQNKSGSDDPDTTYKLVKPNVAGYTTDIYFNLRFQNDASPYEPQRVLDRIDVTIPIGTEASGAILAPLPTFSPSASHSAPPTLNDHYTDAPHQPRVNGTVIPNVRFTGLGLRYSAQRAIINNALVVTLLPNIPLSARDSGDPWQKIFNNQDLSFVVQDVVLNGSSGLNAFRPGQYYKVQVKEVYWSPGGEARTEVVVPVYLMD